MDERGAESLDERRERRNEQGLTLSPTTLTVAAVHQIECLAGLDYPGDDEGQEREDEG